VIEKNWAMSVFYREQGDTMLHYRRTTAEDRYYRRHRTEGTKFGGLSATWYNKRPELTRTQILTHARSWKVATLLMQLLSCQYHDLVTGRLFRLRKKVFAKVLFQSRKAIASLFFLECIEAETVEREARGGSG
jgi:hypothetical protein